MQTLFQKCDLCAAACVVCSKSLTYEVSFELGCFICRKQCSSLDLWTDPTCHEYWEQMQGSKLRPFWSHMLPKCNLCESKIYLGAFVRVQIIVVVRPLQFSAKRSRITAKNVSTICFWRNIVVSCYSVHSFSCSSGAAVCMYCTVQRHIHSVLTQR